MQAHKPRRVLVIEDDREIAALVRLHLVDLGCEVHLADDGAAGLARAQAGAFDLVILDVMLPGMDGLEICKRLRAGADYLPILMTTSKASELDRVLGLELGADDYLTKPFSVGELMARVKAIFRRVDAMAAAAAKPPPALLSAGELSIDLDRRVVTLAGRPVELTAKEFDLLLFLVTNPRQVFSRDQLMERVWGYTAAVDSGTVTVHVRRLREKIEADPAVPVHLETVWGVGYRFTP